jgi:hypothetical protein
LAAIFIGHYRELKKYLDDLMNKFYRWTSRGLFYLISIAFLFGSVKEIWDGYRDNNLPIARIIISLIIFSFAVWIIYGLININKLTIIKGKDKETNKRLIYDLAKEQFPDMGFLLTCDELLGTRNWTTKKTGKEIKVIFKDSDIFVNILNKLRFGDIDSPFHVVGNQADIKEMKSKFETRL